MKKSKLIATLLVIVLLVSVAGPLSMAATNKNFVNNVVYLYNGLFYAKDHIEYRCTNGQVEYSSAYQTKRDALALGGFSQKISRIEATKSYHRYRSIVNYTLFGFNIARYTHIYRVDGAKNTVLIEWSDANFY